MVERPLVIAHRGASGYLPEHTLAAKALAYDQGADFLEQDVVATRDGQLVVYHDLFLDRLTDVAEVFPGRARPDGRHYVIDFDWDELRTLSIHLRPAKSGDVLAADGAHVPDEQYRICLLEEELEFIARRNRESGRSAGVYPEIKHPRWHADHGFDLTAAVVSTLRAFGYEKPDSGVFVQCFDADALIRIRRELSRIVPLVLLVGRSTASDRLTRSALLQAAESIAALAPNFRQLLSADRHGNIELSGLFRDARSAGLELHPYTFNLDSLPSYADDLPGLLALVYEHVNPDAVFCDFPDVAVQVRDRRAASLV